MEYKIKGKMNSLKVNEMVYKFQDLVGQKKVKTFTEFQNEIYLNFIIFDKNHKSYKFISYELKKMHAFLKEIQHYPNSHILAQALEPMFRMLVNGIIIPKFVHVMNNKCQSFVTVKYSDLISASSGKRLIQKTCDSFVIPYRGKTFTKNRLLKLTKKPKDNWLAIFLGEKIFETAHTNPSLRDEIDQIIYGADENGFIDTYSKEFIQLATKLQEFYLRS